MIARVHLFDVLMESKAKEKTARQRSQKKAVLAEKRKENLKQSVFSWAEHEDGGDYSYFVKLKAAYFVKS